MYYTGSINTEFEQLKDFKDYEIKLVDGLAIIRRIENQLYAEYQFWYPGVYFVVLNNEPEPLHIIIAKHYIEHDSKYNVVEHIDKNRLNYKITNLRWIPTLYEQFLLENKVDSQKYRKYTDNLPPGAVALSCYNYHQLKKDVVFHNGTFYYKGDKSNELPLFITKNDGRYVQVEDINNEKVNIYITKWNKIKYWE